MRVRTVATMVLLIALPLSACSSSNDAASDTPAASPVQELPDSTWDLARYLPAGEPDLAPVPDGLQATAEFTTDQIAGSGGCNIFSGAYTTDGTSIEIGPLASTAKACMSDAMNLESDYLSRLGEAATYTISGDTLSMSDATGQVVLSYTRAVHAALTGTTWLATGINTGTDAVSPPLTGTTVTAVLGEDGTISGSAGCNTYNGTYELSGKALTIGPLATTEMACEPDVAKQEANYLAALGRVTRYTIRGDVLELRDDEGALQAGYAAERTR